MPCLASKSAATSPTGPAPTTTTPKSTAALTLVLARKRDLDISEAANFRFYQIALLQKLHRVHCSTNTSGRACENQITGLERHGLT